MNHLKIHSDWAKILEPEFAKPYFENIMHTLAQNKAAGLIIFPPESQILAALNITSFQNLKVVIIGQDPYHGVGEANGLCFSVNYGVKIPPSLRNIFLELTTDIEGFVSPNHGNLQAWALQGVLLLNTSLTVIKDNANSHAKIGWQNFTNKIIEEISNQKQKVVFILWGKNAHQMEKYIDANKHFVLKGVHPSPLSAHRGFFGCKHFSKTNQFLVSQNLKPIDWHIK